jgi:hypothetical protein
MSPSKLGTGDLQCCSSCVGIVNLFSLTFLVESIC